MPPVTEPHVTASYYYTSCSICNKRNLYNALLLFPLNSLSLSKFTFVFVLPASPLSATEQEPSLERVSSVEESSEKAEVVEEEEVAVPKEEEEQEEVKDSWEDVKDSWEDEAEEGNKEEAEDETDVTGE